MLQAIVNFVSTSRRQFTVPLTGLLLTVGMLSGEMPTAQGQESHSLDANNALITQLKASRKAATDATRGNLPQQDGVYLYGRSPQPNQLGEEYIIFQVRQNQVVGAFYMPQSEFSCFHGQYQTGQLALVVAGYPDDGNTDIKLAAVTDRPYGRSLDQPISYPLSVALREYHPIATVAANDQRILEMCQQNK